MKPAFVVGVALAAGCNSAPSGQADSGTPADARSIDGGNQSGGDGTIDPATYRSGNRIKVRTLRRTITTADGARFSETSFSGWFDSARNAPCAPGLASDGKMRCLPEAAQVASGFFSDAACSIPIVLSATDVACGRLALARPASIAIPQPTCSAQPLGARLHEVGSPSMVVYSKSGTACNMGPSGFGGYPVAGPEIPPGLFPEMTIETIVE